MDQNIVQHTFLQVIGKHKRSPSGWIIHNCPACVHLGKNPDTRMKAGLLFLPGGGVRYNCFVCNFKTFWAPGMHLSRKVKEVLKYFGIDNNTINKLVIEAGKLKDAGFIVVSDNFVYNNTLEIASLPKGSLSITKLANENCSDPQFLSALEYLIGRDPNIFEWYNDFYWSYNMKDRIIMPVKYLNQIYGWSARLTRPQKSKTDLRYLNSKMKFLFNADRLFDTYRNFVIITEGIFDAIAVSGISTLGNDLTAMQLQWINNSDKEKIVLLDRDENGYLMAEQAIKNGWSVSFPPFADKLPDGKPLKDAADALLLYGRVMLIYMILKYKESNPVKIKMLAKKWTGMWNE